MKLSVKDRLMLLNVLPAEGNFLTLKIVRQLREALSFSEAEHERFGLREEGGVARWEKSEDREYKFAPKALALIHETLKKLDESGKLFLPLMDLADKFLGTGREEERLVETEEPGESSSPASDVLETVGVPD